MLAQLCSAIGITFSLPGEDRQEETHDHLARLHAVTPLAMFPLGLPYDAGVHSINHRQQFGRPCRVGDKQMAQKANRPIDF